jgi:hypothetical protein
MAITLVQTKSGNAGSYSNTNVQAFSSNVTAGNFIVLAITAGSADTIASVVDSLSNSYTLATSDASADRTTWVYYAQNITGGACTITVTYGAGQFPDSIVQAREYSGLATSSALDVSVSANTGTSFVNSHPSGTSVTTTQNDELVFTVVGSSGSADPVFTAPAGYGNLAAQSGFDAFTYSAIADKIISTTGTQSATFGSTGFVRSQTILVTFKEAPAAAPNYSSFFQFM